ncbi:MAG TPA: PASTA domain-containing protein, partial [Gaiellaceae bacterium]
LYSLGVVLYELLTGKTPFEGDTPVEIAMKHLSATPKPPSELRKDIPPELDMVVLRALAKDPNERYQSADEMEGDLDRVARGLPVAAATVDAATQVLRRTPATPVESTAATMIAPVPGAARDVPPPIVEEEEHVGHERPWWAWLLALLFVVAAVVAGIFVWQEVSGSKPTIPVQLYTGQPVQQAEQQIRNANLTPSVHHGSSERFKKGIVFKQDPDPGTKLHKGDTVTIFASTGPPKVTIPDVKGKQWTDAQQELSDAGFQPVEHIVPGNTKGQVTATDPPAGQSIPKGSKVRVNVASGPQQAHVPSVVGQSLNQASSTLHSAGFNVNPTYVDSSAPQNQVIHQNPSPGTAVPKGSTVDLEVSNGPPSVQVPDVVADSSQLAAQTLANAGFTVTRQYQSVSDPSQDNIVQEQSPSGGTQATKGSPVTITIGQYSPGPATTTSTTTSGPPPPP